MIHGSEIWVKQRKQMENNTRLSVQSLRNKIDTIDLMLKTDFNVEFICFTEHHLTKAECETGIYNFHSYKIGSEFCRAIYRGGGG